MVSTRVENAPKDGIAITIEEVVTTDPGKNAEEPKAPKKSKAPKGSNEK